MKAVIQIQLRQLHTDYWEERAEKVLSHFQHETPDEINIFDICRRYGIRVLPLDTPFLNEHIQLESLVGLKAFSIPKERARRGTIFIKEGLNDIDKKLIVAEEFCHLYAHHSSQLNVDKYLLAKDESQAKRMAAYLLMPQRFINKVYDIAVDESVLISDVADYFLVSDEFAHYRLELIFNHKVDVISTLRGKLSTLEWFG